MSGQKGDKPLETEEKGTKKIEKSKKSGLRKLFCAWTMAQSMFCALPCPCRWEEEARSWMLPLFPLVGVVIGALWFGLWRAMAVLALPAGLSAAVLAAYPYFITGAIHLDGFLDTSDALLSRRSLEEKLRILKDPHTGAFAIVSFGLLLLLSFGAALSIVQEGKDAGALLAVPVLSRAVSAVLVLTVKPLPTSQYSGEFSRRRTAPQWLTALGFGLLALAGSTLLWGGRGLLVLVAAAVGQLLFTLGAVRSLSGISGDLSGYGLTIGEACALMALAAL